MLQPHPLLFNSFFLAKILDLLLDLMPLFGYRPRPPSPLPSGDRLALFLL